jgi:hypothetical protein
MAERKIPQIPAVNADHITTTRSEALREALKAGTTPQPPREFSTLVERPEAAEPASGCADERSCLVHGGGLQRGDFVWPERTALAIAQALTGYAVGSSRSVRAGGTDGSGDVVDDEREREPRAAASGERHDSGAQREE